MMLGVKGQLTIQTIFYILMLVLMVAIIVFGVRQLFFVSDIVSEGEFIEMKSEIRESLEKCSDPLNRGNSKIIEVKVSQINAMCIIGDDDYVHNSELAESLDLIKEAEENVVLLDTVTVRSASGTYDLLEFEVIDTFRVDMGSVDATTCRFQYDEPVFNIPITCE